MIDVSPRAIVEWIGDRTDEFVYTDNENCALAQYLKSLGLVDVSVSTSHFSYRLDNKEVSQDIPKEVDYALCYGGRDFASLKAGLQQSLIA